MDGDGVGSYDKNATACSGNEIMFDGLREGRHQRYLLTSGCKIPNYTRNIYLQ